MPIHSPENPVILSKISKICFVLVFLAWVSFGHRAFAAGTKCQVFASETSEGTARCVGKINRSTRDKAPDPSAPPEPARPSEPRETPSTEPPSRAPNAVIRGFPVLLGKCERGTAQGFIEQIPGCNPNDPAVTAPPPPTPDEYVAAFLTELKALVPKPTLHVAPGWALVGKYAYLEAVAPLQYANTNGVIAWNCAVGSSSIDWGDGTVESMSRANAGPWPNGSARHVYINKGFYDLVVSESWNCAIDTPTGPAALGLDGVTPPLNLRADEIQAVGVA